MVIKLMSNQIEDWQENITVAQSDEMRAPIQDSTPNRDIQTKQFSD